jgi:hypothetical protein
MNAIKPKMFIAKKNKGAYALKEVKHPCEVFSLTIAALSGALAKGRSKE